MIVAIHQPHYFPWLGYLDKMAKADKFVVLDEVQLTDRSPMVRNKFLQSNGESKFLSLSIEKKGYRDKKTKEIVLFNTDELLKNHEKFIIYNYKKSLFFEKIWEEIKSVFLDKYVYLIELEMKTVSLLRNLFNIKTDIAYQSNLDYDRDSKNSDLMLSLTKAVGGNIYLSGNGARSYMKEDEFNKQGVRVVYQEFSYPKYSQFNSKEFVPNLSALDMLFNLGVEKSREIFWNNVDKQKIKEK